MTGRGLQTVRGKSQLAPRSVYSSTSTSGARNPNEHACLEARQVCMLTWSHTERHCASDRWLCRGEALGSRPPGHLSSNGQMASQIV